PKAHAWMVSDGTTPMTPAPRRRRDWAMKKRSRRCGMRIKINEHRRLVACAFATRCASLPAFGLEQMSEHLPRRGARKRFSYLKHPRDFVPAQPLFSPSAQLANVWYPPRRRRHNRPQPEKRL